MEIEKVTSSLNNKFSPKEMRELQKETGNFNLSVNKSREVKTKLGKDDFLKLLVVQMKHQDPLQPMKNTEAIAQMAQFSALEQMVKVGDSMALMAKGNERIEAQNLLGKNVHYYSADKENFATGLVNAIHYEEDGEARITVGDEKIMLKDISGIYSHQVDKVTAETAYGRHQ